MKGLYNVRHKYPYTPGWEGSGVVVAAGPGMFANSLIGKRVAFNKAFEVVNYKLGGAMADYICTDDRSVIPVGDDISLEQASAFFVNPLTALGMVDRAKELGATSIIVTAAAS